MVGLAAFVLEKEIVLRIDFDEPRVAIGVKGKIVRTEDVENRKDLVALAIAYHENEVPMGYKMHINNYLSQQRKTQINENEQQTGQTSGAPAKNHAAKTSAKPVAEPEAAELPDADDTLAKLDQATAPKPAN